MPRVLDIDGVSGKAAIYTVDAGNLADDAPLTNPRANYARLSFHSDFDYMRIVGETTVQVTLPTLGKNQRRNATYNLVAHGLPGTPLIFGAVFIPNAGWCPMHIGAPTHFINPNGSFSSAITARRLISLGSNGTFVVLREAAWSNYSLNGDNALNSLVGFTLSIRILFTSEFL